MSAPQDRDKILLETGTNELEVITFYLRTRDKSSGKMVDTYYGINAAKVSEMVAVPEEVTNVANSPECVLGVFLLRGKTIPLIDLCRWFNYEADESEESRRKWTVIVSELNGKHFGFVCHGVDKVYRTSWESILPPHELIAASRSITGMVIIENRLVQMIDFENITASIDPSNSMKASKESVVSNPCAGSSGVIAVAEDSGVIRDMLVKVLGGADFKVVDFCDGQSCWDYLSRVKNEGRAAEEILGVISDIEMPRMDGHHLCKQIKGDEAFAKVPVILFSSMINDALKRKGEQVGADAQITKPELDLLVHKLSELLVQYRGVTL